MTDVTPDTTDWQDGCTRLGLLVKGGAVGAGLALGRASGALAAPRSTYRAATSTRTRAKIVMNWFAQADQGGYWQAQAELLARANGVDIEVSQGGPRVQVVPLVASGQFAYGITNIARVLLARAQGVPVVAVFAPLDTNPQILMYHPESGIKGFADLSGRTVEVVPAADFWLYIKKKFNLTNVKEVSFSGTLANWARDTNGVVQGFLTSEPWVADQQGLSHAELLNASMGYNPYPNVLFTTEDKIRTAPKEVAAVVQAVKQGWLRFLANPAKGQSTILAANKDQSAPLLKFSIDIMRSRLVGRQRKIYGDMTERRVSLVAFQLALTGLLTQDVDWRKVADTRFIRHPELFLKR